MKTHNIDDVFRPKTMPSYTYINRMADRANGITYEAELKKALSNSGSLISITGASKTGKTVLYNKVVDKDKIVNISGAQIQEQKDFWGQIAERLELPDEWQVDDLSQEMTGTTISSKIRATLQLIFSVEGSGSVRTKKTEGKTLSRRIVRTNSLIMQILIKGGYVLVIDDFHYIDLQVQKYIARTLKAELFYGLKAIVLSLPHRSDDAIRRNPDLIGRTTFIELAAWSDDDLKEIARKGFALLDIPIDEKDIACIAQESALSPQLMQENCFNLAYRMMDNAEKKTAHQLIDVAFFDTAENYRHYNDTIQQVLEGPARGRSRRKQYRLKDNTVCDIYALLLVSISASPPTLKFSLDEISRRMVKVLDEGEALPNRLGLSNIAKHIEKIMKGSIPDLDTVDWKGNTLYILDPFLLFYLRWGKNWRPSEHQ